MAHFSSNDKGPAGHMDEPSVFSAPLTHKEHTKITGYLKTLSNQELINVGAKLGLHYPTLKKMNQDSLLNDMVNAWLRRDDDVTDEPTWLNLISALDDCNHKGIASNIRKELRNEPTKQPKAGQISIGVRELMDEHESYHQAITPMEAKKRLITYGRRNCYLTRYCEKQQCYVLSVYQNSDIKHFKIVFKDKFYQIEGNNEKEKFYGLKGMLDYYEKHRIDPALFDIGQCFSEQEYKQEKQKEETAKVLVEERESELKEAVEATEQRRQQDLQEAEEQRQRDLQEAEKQKRKALKAVEDEKNQELQAAKQEIEELKRQAENYKCIIL